MGRGTIWQVLIIRCMIFSLQTSRQGARCEFQNMQLPFSSWKRERDMFFEWTKTNVISLPSVNQSTDHSYTKVHEHNQSDADTDPNPRPSGVQSGPNHSEDQAGDDSL